MTIEHEELAKLVPHKGKMFIIDRIIEANPEAWTIESETKITENFMFYDKTIKAVPNYACFEIIAQTIAALAGFYTRENNIQPKVGFILSVSNLNFDFDSIKSGETVRARAIREAVVDNVFSFRAEILLDGKSAGNGKLTLMQIENDPNSERIGQ